MKALERLFNRVYGADSNPLYQSGVLAVFLLLLAGISGVYLLLFYDITNPHGSVEALHGQVWTGRWIRSFHRYASDATVVAVLFHILKMWTSSRTWGPRARAWRSGWVLLGGLLFCGWTGLVLVWDEQSYLLATEATRALDTLPIFSEPLGQIFSSPTISHSFFFALLFLHVAVPLGLAGIYLVHVSRVARPTHQPPTLLKRYTGLALAVTAVLLPVAPLAAADPSRLSGKVSIDLLYVAWLPLTAALPGWGFWVFGILAFGLVMAVPNLTKPKKQPGASFVDATSCTGCTTCTLDCPYQAIAMVARTGPTSEDGRHSEYVALVDPELCVSCGICAGSCAPMGVGPPERRGRDQLEAVKAWFEASAPQGDLIVVSCGESARQLGDYPVYQVDCAGSVHTSVLEFLIRRGGVGVYLVTCPWRDCRNREGPKWANERIFHGREAELQSRVDRRRIRVGAFAAAETAEALRDIHAFAQELGSLEDLEREVEPNLDIICEEKPVEQA